MVTQEKENREVVSTVPKPFYILYHRSSQTATDMLKQEKQEYYQATYHPKATKKECVAPGAPQVLKIMIVYQMIILFVIVLSTSYLVKETSCLHELLSSESQAVICHF